MIVLSCCAPYGVGGLGRTLSDATAALAGEGQACRVFAAGVGTGSALGSALTCVAPRLPGLLARIPPIRFDVGLQQHLAFERFDRAVARRLSGRPSAVIGFAGQALHTFRRARALGCRRFEIVSATGHLGHVWRQHRRAEARYPIERDWLTRAHLDRALAEYDMADVIHVGSDYTWDTFVNQGVAASKLHRIPVSADRRFTPAGRTPARGDDVFRVVYTGSLSVVKGVPLLLDAFAAFDRGPAVLTLVGSTGSRGMRRDMARRCAADPRVVMAPGDPLPHLQRADLYVHPSYQDGFGYAVAEALACGVPAIVTADTGARSLVTPGVNGDVVPTDDPAALTAAMERWHARDSARRRAADAADAADGADTPDSPDSPDSPDTPDAPGAQNAHDAAVPAGQIAAALLEARP